jgi:hypothetical protein
MPATTTVTFPAGVRHIQASGFAQDWPAYDALTAEDGWEERSWWCTEADGKGCEPTDDGATLHTHKETTIGGCRVVVSPPFEART